CSIRCCPYSPYLPSVPTRRSSDLSLGLSSLRTKISMSSVSSVKLTNRRRCSIKILAARLTASSGRTLPSVHTSSSSWKCGPTGRSEEHTSELQSREKLVCRLLLEQ